jgi:hypothetical protein
MQLQIGDRLTDETGDWAVIGRPFTTAAGKNAHVRVRRVNQPETADLKTYSAHERVQSRTP